jgi:hypothetical protein
VLQLKRRRQSGRRVRGEKRETNLTMASHRELTGERKQEQGKEWNGMILSLKKRFVRVKYVARRGSFAGTGVLAG